MRNLTRCTAVIFLALATLLGCASTGATSGPKAEPQGSARPAAAADRQRFVELFARGYFPGRSGQLFYVLREGDALVSRDPYYKLQHGTAWDHDARIPLILHGAPFIRSGQFDAPAAQQDLVPTLAALLGTQPPATATGRVLSEALTGGAARPRLAVVVVVDGMRADYFDTHSAVMPTLARLRREGASFANARINYLPTMTSVGHATIGTGADPRVHGQATNTLYNKVTRRPQDAYFGLDPGELMALTLADAWSLQTEGKAIVIGQGGAIRATAGLVGHGACLVGGYPMVAASYAASDGGWETNPKCYTKSAALAPLNARQAWEAAGGTWMGHDIANPSKIRASSVFQRFEGEALMAVVEAEAVGADAVTDLVLVNLKSTDWVGHAYGPDSKEMTETLAELDRQLAQLMALVARKAGAGGAVVAVTADHGMPSEPPAGRRFYTDTLIAAINQRFDPEGKTVVEYLGDAAASQVHINRGRLAALGHSLDEVARFLETQPYIMAAFTEDEVRAGLQRPPQP